MKKSVHDVLPTKYGEFIVHVWPEKKGHEPIAIRTINIDISKPVLVRVHSECLTGDTFGSKRCDCAEQKEAALKMIYECGNGMMIYLRQEGRGIGLYEKIKSYRLQSEGIDTYDANIELGHEPDLREYSQIKMILDELNVHDIKLLTNNPEKLKKIADLGISIVERVPLVMDSNEYNEKYLEVKKTKFKHLI